MIIQCKQCRTKFRFDDSNMQGSGVWLRCSRCGHVYFQENPLAKKSAADAAMPEPEPVIPEERIIPQEKPVKPKDETPSVFRRNEDGLKSLDKIMASRKRMDDDIALDAVKKPEENVSQELYKEEEFQEEEKETTGVQEKKKPAPAKGSGRALKIALWSVLVIVVIPGLFYYYAFFMYPELGQQIFSSSENLVKIVNEYRGIKEPVNSGTLINQMIKIQDVRYRRINNYTLGQIGVLEGTAVNRAEYPVSRIKIKGEIVDAYSVVLGERTDFAGNILTDEELTNLSEEEITAKLQRPEGLNNSNDKILPGGQIPFMIVFSNEPSGVIKTTAVVAGAERLL